MATIQTVAVDSNNDVELSKRFTDHLKSISGVASKITILPPDTLPRATHKAKRVEDRRQNVWN